jgi:hypothetical protein
MSNYPPGVTGNEYEISGPDWEGTLEVKCPNQEAQLEVVSKEMSVLLDRYRTAVVADDGEEVFRCLRDLKYMIVSEPKAMLTAPCAFVGEVDAAGYQGKTWWTCPLCGAENEEEPYDDYDPPEPDPDAWMEAQERYERWIYRD